MEAQNHQRQIVDDNIYKKDKESQPTKHPHKQRRNRRRTLHQILDRKLTLGNHIADIRSKAYASKRIIASYIQWATPIIQQFKIHKYSESIILYAVPACCKQQPTKTGSYPIPARDTGEKSAGNKQQ